MPTYYFHLNTGSRGRTSDPDGCDLADDAAAREHAREVARELMRNNKRRMTWWFDVCGSEGALRFELLFATVDEVGHGLPPKTRALYITMLERYAEWIRAMNDARATLRDAHSLRARAHNGPKLRLVR